MRLSLVVLALAALAATASAQPAPPAGGYGEALLVVSGRGWGHGVGMSQYGALGMAKAGRSHDEILAYYYTGTELQPAPTTELRVLLAEGRRAVAIGSAVPFTARDATGRIRRLPAGTVTLGPDLQLPTSTPGAPPATRPKPPLVFRPGKESPLALDGRQYRGRLEVGVQGEYVRVVNIVALESYVQGVVAGEMPFTWPREALRAQAVAARSYALATLVKGKPFDLYSDVRSQVYLGVEGEKPATTDAVRSTAGEVVTYAGEVATTFYFSSSGGRTASAADVFGTPVPYLVSRPDPWDKLSPFHRWGPLLFGARTIQSKLAADARVIDVAAVPTPSGRLRSLVLQTTAGPETVPASLVRTALGLRSTWLSVGVLRLDPPDSMPLLFGASVELSGIARGLGPARLASSPDGMSWSQAGALVGRSGGVASVTVRPTRTMRYRLEVAGAASPGLLVQVAPRLELTLPREPDALSGTVRPKLVGVAVTIERRRGTVWTPVVTSAVDGGGTFRAELPLSAGSYRAQVGPTAGLVAGTSPVLQVPG